MVSPLSFPKRIQTQLVFRDQNKLTTIPRGILPGRFPLGRVYPILYYLIYKLFSFPLRRSGFLGEPMRLDLNPILFRPLGSLDFEVKVYEVAMYGMVKWVDIRDDNLLRPPLQNRFFGVTKSHEPMFPTGPIYDIAHIATVLLGVLWNVLSLRCFG